jgi:uncharacterized membrane protein
MNKSRFEAFSDGVFAFAITLLILGVVLPPFTHPPTDGELARALLGLWPNVVAYILSFAVIGIMWQNHHALFRLVERVDRTTVFHNLVLLMATVSIPFATSVLGTYEAMHSSTFLYGLVLTICASAYNIMLHHLIRTNAFHANVSEETKKQTVRAYLVGLATYISAMLLSLLWPTVSFIAYLGITGYYLFPRGVDAD